MVLDQAILLAIIAWSGLSTWKTQLKGTHDFELGRRLLLSIYKYREAIKLARNAFLQPGEADKGRTDWEVSAYENRWKQISEAAGELSTAVLEAEVSWGENFKSQTLSLRKLTARLNTATRHYLASQGNGLNSRLFSEADDKVLWGYDDDEFEQDLFKIVEAFEIKIKPKIGRR